ncbi:MAG: hypothetical protein K1X64_16880 [Myxococcaceae bacterium]|nr:hypothetical protein [Myxococcaceae bacterium]
MPAYSGSCHCKAVRFTFSSEPLAEAVRCNSSICVRNSTTKPVYFRVNLGCVDGVDPYAFSIRLIDGKSF